MDRMTDAWQLSISWRCSL